jgi:hypothetical protein
MRRVDPPVGRTNTVAAAARWHATLRHAYLGVAEKSALEYLSVQWRMHRKVWSHSRLHTLG